jgi:uncharacterized membrane protein HdeD (DUF308 family)
MDPQGRQIPRSSSWDAGDAMVASGDAEVAFRAWWRRVALLGGVVSIALGLILMIWPEATLLVAAVLIGLWLILTGAVTLARAAFIPEGRSPGGRVLQAIAGLLFVVLGVVCMRNLNNSLTLIALIIGIAWLFGGIVEIFTAFTPVTHGWGRLGALLLGIIAVAAAVTILAWPQPSLRVIVWVTGLWFVLIGLVQLVLGWQARRATASRATA